MGQRTAEADTRVARAKAEERRANAIADGPIDWGTGEILAFGSLLLDARERVFPSPFDAFDAYERHAGLPERFIRTVVAKSADDGAWARFERSELDFPSKKQPVQ